MTEHNIQRRDVLKAVSTASAFGTVGTVQGSKARKGSIRLAEIGIEYNLPEGYNYQRVHVEGKSPYYIDGDTVTLSSVVPDKIRDTFVGNDVVVNGVDWTTIPSKTAKSTIAEAIPTSLAARKDPHELTHLTNSHRLPNVQVEVDGNDLIVAVEDIRKRVVPRTEHEFNLDPQIVSAKTYRVTDEIAEIEGVPEHKWGPKTEYESVDVKAVPSVTVRDQGKLDLQT